MNLESRSSPSSILAPFVNKKLEVYCVYSFSALTLLVS